jgi:ribosomal protein S18 acetylase RimI-like enzyme
MRHKLRWLLRYLRDELLLATGGPLWPLSVGGLSPGSPSTSLGMDTDLVIRPFAVPDFDELTEVWHNVNRSAYPYVAAHQRYTLDEARAFFQTSVLPSNRLWVASLGTSIVGFIAVDATHINQLAVDVNHQHRGIGSALLRYLLATTEGPWRLFTYQRNESARRFYERHGFCVVRFGTSPPPENEPDVEYLLERR